MGRSKRGQALTNTERQRIYRAKIKSDPTLHQEYLQRERDRWKIRKVSKKVKGIDDMSNREQRRQRRQWRRYKRKEKERKNTMHTIVDLSPPTSPEAGPAENEEPDPDSPPPPQLKVVAGPSTKKKLGRKRVKAERAKCYRDIQNLKMKLKKSEMKADKYRKRLARLSHQTESPRSLTKQMLKTSEVTPSVRQSLLFHNTLVSEIRKKYAKGNHKEKISISKLMARGLMKKYKLLTFAKTTTGVSTRPAVSRAKYAEKQQKTAELVQRYLERDENSRITTGKSKDCMCHSARSVAHMPNNVVSSDPVAPEQPAENVSTSETSPEVLIPEVPMATLQNSPMRSSTSNVKIHSNKAAQQSLEALPEMQKRKKRKKQKTQKASKPRKKAKSSSEMPCTYCKFYYGDNKDPLKHEEWVKCETCSRWFHETCAETVGIIGDDGFFCNKCL